MSSASAPASPASTSPPAHHRRVDLRGLRGRTQRRRHLVLEHLSGARCDVESIYYSYSFDEALQQEWTWSQRFAPQAEILSYIEHVADRFDLRKHFTVQYPSGRRDVERGRPAVGGVAGQRRDPPQPLPDLGCRRTVHPQGLRRAGPRELHRPPGVHQPLEHLARRPRGQACRRDRHRISGVQAIPLIAEVAEHVTVFQRTPNYVMPARNAELRPEQVDAIKDDYLAIREECRHSPGGIPDRPVTDNAFDVSDEERRRRYEEAYERSGFQGVGAEFADLLTDAEANRTASEFIHDKIREIVEDPATAELLVPKYHPLGAKRSVFGTDYYETYNRPNVSLVSLRDEPIETMTANAIVTSKGTYEVDAVVLAIGFDAFTGPLYGLNLTGASGKSCRRPGTTASGPTSGFMTTDFPNFFMVAGP